MKESFKNTYDVYKASSTYTEYVNNYEILVSEATQSDEINICDQESIFFEQLLNSSYYSSDNFFPCLTPEEMLENNLVSDNNKEWFEMYEATLDPGENYEEKVTKLYEKYKENRDEDTARSLLELGWDISIEPTFINKCKVSRVFEEKVKDRRVNIIDV